MSRSHFLVQDLKSTSVKNEIISSGCFFNHIWTNIVHFRGLTSNLYFRRTYPSRFRICKQSEHSLSYSGHWKLKSNHQNELQSEKVTFWCSLQENGLVGPYYFTVETVRVVPYYQMRDTNVWWGSQNIPTECWIPAGWSSFLHFMCSPLSLEFNDF